MISLLVIGYGSPLHRDDAAGRHVAERVAAWEQPDVRAVSVRQLTPELSVSISQALRVVFVDASLVESGGPVKLSELRPEASATLSAHFSDPAWLLGLCRTLYGTCPEAWLLKIPTVDLELGEELSAVGKAGVEGALDLLASVFVLPPKERAERRVFAVPEQLPSICGEDRSPAPV